MTNDDAQALPSPSSHLAAFDSHQPPDSASTSKVPEPTVTLPKAGDTDMENQPEMPIELPNEIPDEEDKQPGLHDTALQVIDLGPEVEGSEMTSANVSGSSDGGSQEEDIWDHDAKRVKVYQLIGSRWIDHGTAFCYGNFQEDTGDALLIARSESDEENIILSTTIRPTDVYQRQQDTLIVWTEPDGADYALSFQDSGGCLEVWNFILEVQRYLNGPDQAPSSSPFTGTENSITTATIIRLGHLPEPSLGNIEEIDKAIKALSRTQAIKEKLCEYIQREDYIKYLIDVMNQAEDLESIENLHALCSLMQTILMMNDHTMYEYILNDEIFFGVVGMLEYDPEFPTHKGNYREFLNQTLRFHQPIKITEPTIQRKIHHAYRLQFLKDVVLVRVLDDSTFNVLNSCILFNQIDIINHVQQDPAFLRDVVRLYVDEDMLNGGGVRQTATEQAAGGSDINMADAQSQQGSVSQEPKQDLSGKDIPVQGLEQRTDAETQREVVLLIQQLCNMGKNVQLPARLSLFRSLVDHGILFAVQWALGLPENEESSKAMINAGGEILSALLDHDLPGVRCHVVKQVNAIDKEMKAGKKGAEKAETLLMLLCRVMTQSKDLAVQCIVGDSLKTWLEVPTGEADARTINGLKNLQRDDAGTEKFLEYFYTCCAATLFEPFHTIPEWKTLKEPILHLTKDNTNRFLYLCDFLHNFEMQHAFRSHVFIISSDVSVQVASLLRAKDKHLRHAAFRFFHSCLRPNAGNLRNYFMKRDIFRPVLELTLQESRRDNLLSSSCREFFEHIRRDNIKELINHCMTVHEPLVRKLTDIPLSGPRFILFIRRWEMNNEPPPDESDSIKPAPSDSRRRAGRHIEAEEENYFNADDDDDDLGPSLSLPMVPGAFSQTLQPPSGLKRKRRINPAYAKGYRPQPLTPLRGASLSTLVDYDEDEDEDGEVIGPMPLVAGSNMTHDAEEAAKMASIIDAPFASQTPTPMSKSPKRSLKTIDDDDNMLEALAQGKSLSQPLSSGGTSPSSLFSPDLSRTSEKRRRDDQDEEMLDKLRSQVKKRNRGSDSSPTPTIPSSTKNGSKLATNGTFKVGDDPPMKRMKVKFGAGANALANMVGRQTDSGDGKDGKEDAVTPTTATTASSRDPPAPTAPETGVKDGDRG